MSIFTKQVSDISYSDIEELQKDGAIENIRLDFKGDFIDKEKLLKLISAFANTYGGFIVFGVDEKDRKITRLPGVIKQPGFNQQVIQWCFDGIYPPIAPLISLPIDHPTDNNRCFYVIFVPESLEAPHFVNNRGGCYIRTDEHRQKFEPQLAKYEEIDHLRNRRERAIDLREGLISRARSRFDTHVKQSYHSNEKKNLIGEIDVTMWIAIVPSYPSILPFNILELEKAIENNRISNNQLILPAGVPLAQTNGFFYQDPNPSRFGYFEVDQHGLIYYSHEVAIHQGEIPQDAELRKTYQPTPSSISFYAHEIIAWVIYYLLYANKIYSSLGYEGPLVLRVGLDRIRGRKFHVSFRRAGSIQSKPLLDDTLLIEKTISSTNFLESFLNMSRGVLREIAFSCGWKEAYSTPDKDLDRIIQTGLDSFQWNWSDVFPS